MGHGRTSTRKNGRAKRSIRWRRWSVVLTVILTAITGCASITNPVANGIPVALLPSDLLAEPKNDKVLIPLEWLGQRQPDAYRIAPGDVLGIFIDDVLGDREQAPPFTLPEGDLPPALGSSIPVLDDGTIVVPLLDPVQVAGMSLGEVREKLIQEYTVTQQIIDPGVSRFIVTLQLPRTIQVLVLRQDATEGGGTVTSQGPMFQSGLGGFEFSQGESRGTGTVVDLPAYENDVLNALTKSGGLPGFEAVNEVIVRRGGMRQGIGTGIDWDVVSGVTRIPLRLRRGTPRPFNEEDIILHEGDIVLVQERVQDVYYTAGLLGTGVRQLPRDSDLGVVEAVIESNGFLLSGGIRANNLTGNTAQGGVGNPNPSLLTVIRRADDGRQIPIRVDLSRAVQDPRENLLVQRGDILVLQWTPGEAIAKYFKDIINIGFSSTLLRRQDATAFGSFAVP